MQGVMISDLRQEEHLVRLEAKEVRRVIEVRICEPGVHAIAVLERALRRAFILVFEPAAGGEAGVASPLTPEHNM